MIEISLRIRCFTEMARRAANRATNVNAVLLSCARSNILFSLDQQQQQHQTTSMSKKKGRVRATKDTDVYEVEDIRDDRFNPKVGMHHAVRGSIKYYIQGVYLVHIITAMVTPSIN